MKETRERIVAEYLLVKMKGNFSSDILYNDIYKVCVDNKVIVGSVVGLMGDYIDVLDKDLHGTIMSYKLNAKGLEFVNNGCWTAEDKKNQSLIRKDWFKFWVPVAISVVALAVAIIALNN